MQVIQDSAGEVPRSPPPLQGLSKMKNSPQKNVQEITTANELIKNDVNNITESEFRIIVIKLIAGLEKKYRGQQRIYCYRDQGTKEQPGEAKNCYK